MTTTTDLHFDVLIVGSGAGGGAVAKELAPLCQSGARIALLEWGGRAGPHFNTQVELEMAGRYYIEMGGVQNKAQDMTFAMAKGVGGGTNVLTGTSLEAPEKVLARWGLPSLSLKNLIPRYEKYRKEYNVHVLPESESNLNNRLFRDACGQLGWNFEPLPLPYKNCVGLGTCNLGCAADAKMSTALVQIPRAEAQGVEVIPFCRVTKIEERKLHVEILPSEHGMKESPLLPGKHVLTASKIIICAGAFYTPALLLASFGESRWPALGRNFTCHPAIVNIAQHSRRIVANIGAPKTFLCDEFHESDHFLLETCSYFPFTLSKSIVGFGPIVEDFMSNFDHLQQILSLAIDEASWENRIRVIKGKPVIDYKISQETMRALENSALASARIFFASGAEKVHLPFAPFILKSEKDIPGFSRAGQPVRTKKGQASIASAHLMGGCGMGIDEKTSVTDEWGRVHGIKGLYVADASLFPSALEVNPYLTVMALADRVAEAVRNDLGGVQ